MGAMHNDLNRCTFLYDHDRRCRNTLETPGTPFCYYHNHRKPKESEAPPSDELASQALFAWLACHPLDSATQINHALNQLYLCVVGNMISSRRADSLVRMARLLHKMVDDVRREHAARTLIEHVQKTENFQEGINLLQAVACPPDKQESAAQQQETPADAPLSLEASAAATATAGS